MVGRFPLYFEHLPARGWWLGVSAVSCLLLFYWVRVVRWRFTLWRVSRRYEKFYHGMTGYRPEGGCRIIDRRQAARKTGASLASSAYVIIFAVMVYLATLSALGSAFGIPERPTDNDL